MTKPASRRPASPVTLARGGRIGGILGGILGGGLALWGFFWLAGGWGWFRGWSFLALLVIGQGGSGLYLLRRDPEMMARRGEVGPGTTAWDRVLLGLFGLAYCGSLVVAAVEAGDPPGPGVPRWTWPLGAVLYLGSVALLTWAMAANTHFEKTVRIQRDRNHRVIASGPYAIVRHPGYTATILGLVPSAPLVLGSWWAFVPAGVAALVMVLRTFLEDRLLARELEGYRDYARRVRYRLVPGIW